MNKLNIIQKPSPNNWPGRAGYKPEAIVIHIMEGTLQGTDAWFSSISSQVSSHYGIGKRGEIHQYVQEDAVAWHAGRVAVPSWKLLKEAVNPNIYTIGIEHEGYAGEVWTQEMKNSSADLIADICKRWNIPVDREHIIGHYEINSLYKLNCPSLDKVIIDVIIKLVKERLEPPKNIKEQIREHLSKVDELLEQL